MNNKIIRSLCAFTSSNATDSLVNLDNLLQRLLERGFEIQTKRICFSEYIFEIDDVELESKGVLLGMGLIVPKTPEWDDFVKSKNKSVFLI